MLHAPRSTVSARGLLAGLLMLAFAAAQPVAAAQLEGVFSIATEVNQSAQRTQARIDELTEDTRKLLNDYKVVLKEIEGLQVYNQQLEAQISAQEREMADINASLDRVTEVNRQVVPLMLRLVDGLEQFVDLDVPFLLQEREDRISRLRDIMERSDVEVSEKFSQVLSAYQIENEYGRTMETYSDTITRDDGTEAVVNFLRFGRLALVYLTRDGEQAGAWDQAQRSWVELPATYNSQVDRAIRMAAQQISVDIIELPIPGPEDAL
jgi:vacuolar-type H+-ATPase subunit I/STV1